MKQSGYNCLMLVLVLGRALWVAGEEQNLILSNQERVVIPEKDYSVRDLKDKFVKKFAKTNAFRIRSKFQIKKYMNSIKIGYGKEMSDVLFKELIHYNNYFDEIVVEKTNPDREYTSISKDNMRRKYLWSKYKGYKTSANAKESYLNIRRKRTVEITVTLYVVRWEIRDEGLAMVRHSKYKYESFKNLKQIIKCFSLVKKFLDGYVITFVRYRRESGRLTMIKNQTMEIEKRKNEVDDSFEETGSKGPKYRQNQNSLGSSAFDLERLDFLSFFHHNHFKMTLSPENIALASLNVTLKKAFVEMIEKYNILYESDFFDRTVKEVLEDIVKKFRITFIPSSEKEGFSDSKTVSEYFFLLEFESIKLVVKLLKDEYFLTEIVRLRPTASFDNFLSSLNPRHLCYSDPFYNLYYRSYSNYSRFKQYWFESKRVHLACNPFRPIYSMYLVTDKNASKKIQTSGFLVRKPSKSDHFLFKPASMQISVDVDEDAESTESELDEAKTEDKIVLFERKQPIYKTKNSQTQNFVRMTLLGKDTNVRAFDEAVEVDVSESIKEDDSASEKISDHSTRVPKIEILDWDKVTEEKVKKTSPEIKGVYINNNLVRSSIMERIGQLFLGTKKTPKKDEIFGSTKLVANANEHFTIQQKILNFQMKDMESSRKMDLRGYDLNQDCMSVQFGDTRDFHWILCSTRVNEILVFMCNRYYQSEFILVFTVNNCSFTVKGQNFAMKPNFFHYFYYNQNRLVIDCGFSIYIFEKKLGFLEIGRNIEDDSDETRPQTQNTNTDSSILKSDFTIDLTRRSVRRAHARAYPSQREQSILGCLSQDSGRVSKKKSKRANIETQKIGFRLGKEGTKKA